MTQFFNGLLVIGLLFLNTSLQAKTISLAPNETKLLANNGPFTLNATCNLHGTHVFHSKVRIIYPSNFKMLSFQHLKVVINSAI